MLYSLVRNLQTTNGSSTEDMTQSDDVLPERQYRTSLEMK